MSIRCFLLALSGLTLMGCSTLKLPGSDPASGATGSGSASSNGSGSGGTSEAEAAPTLVPALVVTEPARGLMTTDLAATVVGQIRDPDPSLDYAAMVNGQVVDLDDDLRFTQAIELEPGTQFIQTIAADSRDVRSADHRAVLAGSFASPYSVQEDGFVFQVPTGALAEMAGRADDYFAPETLGSFIENPVLKEEEVFCMGWCWTMWGIEMNAHNPDFSSIEAIVEPWDGGIDVQFVMHDFYMDWAGTGVVSEVGYTGYGNVTSAAMVVELSLALDWTADGLVARVLDVHVDSNGFDCYFDSFFYDCLEYFGMDPDFLVVGMMERTFESMMAERLPVVMGELLDDMSFSKTIPAAGRDYVFSGDIADLSATRDGLWVHYDTTFTAPVQLHSGALGPLVRDQTIPAPVSTEDRVVGAIALNLINQMFFALWDGGALDMQMPVEALGLPSAAFAELMPGITEVQVHTTALLPPTVRRSLTGAGLATVSVGDMLLEFYDPNLSTEVPFMVVSMGLQADLDLAVNASGDGVSPVLSGVQVYPSIVAPDSGVSAEMLAGLDGMLTPVAQDALPGLFGSLVSLPLDLIEGFHFLDVTFGNHTGDGSYLKMDATLQVD